MLQAYLAIGALALYCLNPFEVREVLQGGKQEARSRLRLNPFEVREVLQDVTKTSVFKHIGSQSL